MATAPVDRPEPGAGVTRTTPPPALSPPPGNPRFPLMDAARAVAAAMVMIYHVAGQDGVTFASRFGRYFARLNVGVTLFFLISGFLLYRPLVAARLDGRPSIRVRDFARRRLLRIVPAYWVALTLLAAWPGLPGLWQSGWWRYYLFAQNYAKATNLGGISPAWSLCVEMSFYVALPFLAAGLSRVGRVGRLSAASRGLPRARAIRRELTALSLIAAASIVFNAVVLATAPTSFLLSTLPALMDWFAFGMILAVISVAWHDRESQPRALRITAARPWIPWILAAVVFLGTSTGLGLPVTDPFTPLSVAQGVAENVAYALCGILFLLPAIFGDHSGGWPRRLLAAPALVWYGLISYGVFLYHSPLVLKLDQLGGAGWIPGSRLVSLAVVTVVATTAAAAASYYVVERPALRLKEGRRGWRRITAGPNEQPAPPQ